MSLDILLPLNPGGPLIPLADPVFRLVRGVEFYDDFMVYEEH